MGADFHGSNGNMHGFTLDGGYAEYMVAYEDALISIPDGISSKEAAPVLCAVETFPLEEAQAAFDKMMAGKTRFRAVLKMA